MTARRRATCAALSLLFAAAPALAETPAASSAPALTAPAAALPNPDLPSRSPLGSGTLVTITTTRAVQVYVARVKAGGPAPTEYDFIRVGVAPLSFELPPGDYLLEVDDDGVTAQTLPLSVGAEPVSLDVRTGSSDLRTLGSLALGLGILGVLGGAAVLLSGTASEDSGSFDKTKVAVPMLAAGGVLTAGGVGLYFASRTDIEPAPAGAPPAPRALMIGARLAF